MSGSEVPDPRPGEYTDDGRPVDPGVCNPYHIIAETLRMLRAEGYDVPSRDIAPGDDALPGAMLLISGLGLTPRVPGEPL